MDQVRILKRQNAFTYTNSLFSIQVWVPGQFHVEIFASAGVQRQKIKVIPEAVDVHFFDPARSHITQLPLYRDTIKK